jgi:phage terminase small subunit
MALTEQKRRYAEARMSGASKKEAAIAAGCPEKTASQAASRYEKDPDVLAAIGRTQVVKAAVKHERQANLTRTYRLRPVIPSSSSSR